MADPSLVIRARPWLILAVLAIGSATAHAGPPVIAAAPAPTDEDEPAVARAAAAEPSATRWPTRVKDRNLTLPAGLALVGPDVTAVRATGTTTVMESVAVGIGLTDEVELNTLTPTGTMHDFTFAGPWDLGLGVKLLRGAAGGRLEVVARAAAGYDFEAREARPVRLGVQVQFNVTNAIALLVHDTGVMPGVSIGTTADTPISFGLPFGVGLQASDHVWIEADTNLVSSAGLRNAPHVTIADVAPVLGTMVWNVAGGALDVLAYAGCGDAYHALDTAYAGVGARLYVGRR